jgi:hypothetical protein
MCQLQRLPRAFETACIPLGTEDILVENTPFDGFSTGPQCSNAPPALCGIPDSGRWPPYSLDLNLLEFRYLVCFSIKSPGEASGQFGRPASVHRRGMGPVISGKNTLAGPVTYSAATNTPPLKKKKFKLNRWLTNTHQQSFSGPP